jgi:hypothetical protein
MSCGFGWLDDGRTDPESMRQSDRALADYRIKGR